MVFIIGMELVKYVFDIPLSLNILTAGEKYIRIDIKKHKLIRKCLEVD